MSCWGGVKPKEERVSERANEREEHAHTTRREKGLFVYFFEVGRHAHKWRKKKEKRRGGGGPSYKGRGEEGRRDGKIKREQRERRKRNTHTTRRRRGRLGETEIKKGYTHTIKEREKKKERRERGKRNTHTA